MRNILVENTRSQHCVMPEILDFDVECLTHEVTVEGEVMPNEPDVGISTHFLEVLLNLSISEVADCMHHSYRDEVCAAIVRCVDVKRNRLLALKPLQPTRFGVNCGS